MAKKLSLLLTAVAVFAFAVPAFANAATGLTEGGALVPTGKIITGTNVGTENFITTSRTGTITCAAGAVMVEAKLVENTLSKVKAEPGGNAFTANCSTPSGGVAHVKNVKLVKLETTGGGTGTGTIFFELELPGGAVCKYEGIGDVGTYKTAETSEGGNILKFTKQPVTLLSGACGETTIDGEYSIATQATTTKVYLM